MRRFFTIILFVLIASCSKPPVKTEIKEAPSYSTDITDPELKTITDEFFRLSARNNLTFSHKVSVGFSDIERDSVIGTCSYRPTFREIDLDPRYWKRATWTSKVALLYHELVHCYCERDHDYDQGEMYPDKSWKALIQDHFSGFLSPIRPSGYLEDGCSKSNMHPVIMSNECFEKHYDHYVKEMFNRCKAF